MSKKRVLVVDDSAFMRKFISDTLTKEGHEIVGMAATGDSGIEMALELEPDLITLDNVLPDMLGVDIARILLVEEKLKSKVLMISALGQESVIEESKGYGVSDYIVKPFNDVTLKEKVAAIQD